MLVPDGFYEVKFTDYYPAPFYRGKSLVVQVKNNTMCPMNCLGTNTEKWTKIPENSTGVELVALSEPEADTRRKAIVMEHLDRWLGEAFPKRSKYDTP